MTLREKQQAMLEDLVWERAQSASHGTCEWCHRLDEKIAALRAVMEADNV